ncbi:MAG: CbtA family protein [Rhodobiaceae bacterium]|nr:CbtA family protein [Rhodobiaceae bacterium]
MISRVLSAAILAGLLAGLVVTLVQFAKVTPLILQAEVFEVAVPGSAAAAAPETAPAAQGVFDDMERAAMTLGANLITGMGFALVLASAILFSGRAVTLRSGAVWGLAGFLVVALAPALGLAPELPGAPEIDLASRQLWWGGTVLATAAGGALTVLKGGPVFSALGIALIALPHVIGAPQPESHTAFFPAGLAADYAAASLAAAAIFWLVLGAATGWTLSRCAPSEPA